MFAQDDKARMRKVSVKVPSPVSEPLAQAALTNAQGTGLHFSDKAQHAGQDGVCRVICKAMIPFRAGVTGT